MKVILIGHPGSEGIRKASTYLTDKYLKGFEVIYLTHTEGVDLWSRFVADYLKNLTDTLIILGLDDYLLSAPINPALYQQIIDRMTVDENVICGRLCDSSFYSDKSVEGSMVEIGENDYTSTAQYCIWRRKDLIDILERTTSPWDFEINGSKMLNASGKKVVGTIPHALQYPDSSSLSSKWKGVKTEGNNPEDIDYLVTNGYL